MSGFATGFPAGRRRRPVIGLVLAAILAAGGCAGGGAEEEEEVPLVQTKLTDLKQYPGHHIIQFTKLGASRVGLATSPVTGTPEERVAPYAALLYEPDGSTFVYTSPKVRTYRYTPIKVSRIVGNRIYFTGGPKPGDRVVTSGLPQVYGADIQLEFGEIA